MANVLIIGANQGIGYYLVERLLELGNTVTVLDVQISAIPVYVPLKASMRQDMKYIKM